MSHDSAGEIRNGLALWQKQIRREPAATPAGVSRLGDRPASFARGALIRRVTSPETTRL